MQYLPNAPEGFIPEYVTPDIDHKVDLDIHDQIVAGKAYKTTGWSKLLSVPYSSFNLLFNGDVPTSIFCLSDNCAFLNGNSWIACDENGKILDFELTAGRIKNIPIPQPSGENDGQTQESNTTD